MEDDGTYRHHCALPSRHLAIHGDALISNILVRVLAALLTPNVLFESWLQGHSSILGQRSLLEHPVRVMTSALISNLVRILGQWDLLMITLC